ncbi:Ribonuclease/ribotoxin [Macrophomina phaseolina]|uniref:Ribonuclease/ribotoxin n=1 Tax=Macrophomina phaseolina TaxID=35725 RepID=A0ABQ8GB29_9PEZI|nr:Ribonuclease/ribotoxin [Macrophomina phaseolina]
MRSFISILATGLAILTGALAVDCQGKAFTDADVDACVAELCNWDAGRGPGGYPHHFGNRETLSLGQYTTDPDLYEYPMLDNGRVYKGGAPGADRCIAHFDPNTWACTKVGAMTHRNAPKKNAFVLCT